MRYILVSVLMVIFTKVVVSKEVKGLESVTRAKWFAVNDGVMGGLSKGSSVIIDQRLVFSGVLSLENNGGFSSIRTRGNFDLSGHQGLILKLKGDGRNYQLRLATDARYRRSPVSYAATFNTQVGKVLEVKVPFSSLKPSWRGRRLDGPVFTPKNVEEIGLLLGDKKAGDFRLEVFSIRLY